MNRQAKMAESLMSVCLLLVIIIIFLSMVLVSDRRQKSSCIEPCNLAVDCKIYLHISLQRMYVIRRSLHANKTSYPKAQSEWYSIEKKKQNNSISFQSKQLTPNTKAISLMIERGEPLRSHFASQNLFSAVNSWYKCLIRHNHVLSGIHRSNGSKLFQIYLFEY